MELGSEETIEAESSLDNMFQLLRSLYRRRILERGRQWLYRCLDGRAERTMIGTFLLGVFPTQASAC